MGKKNQLINTHFFSGNYVFQNVESMRIEKENKKIKHIFFSFLISKLKKI